MTKTKPVIYVCKGCGKELTENEMAWHMCQGRDDTAKNKFGTLPEILHTLKGA